MSDEQPEITLGPYTMEMRDHYIAYRKARYLIDHPMASEGQAGRAARLGWRRKVKNYYRAQGGVNVR